ncbi:ABC-three component system middle component 1 [Pseudomonas fulva]|uniref:ABC-three component system middle component 1 n=1 Tax=Pseudomonas fulva TaxID=47880 RepID=UPI0038022E6C
MINDIIKEALTAHDFKKEHETESTSFYIRQQGSAIRFAILHKLDELPTPAELNTLIKNSAPDIFLNHPSFKKNCDLICIYHLSKLSEFKVHEEQIFAIEEDPHFFKKYVLYYSDTEAHAIQDYTFSKLITTVSDKSQFTAYKSEPTAATQYSVAAKIFIKLPFLLLPFTRGELISLRLQAADKVAEADLDETYKIIQKFTTSNADDLITELIKHEMENSSN